jgi:chromosomal replication initiation ATPase DnaA
VSNPSKIHQLFLKPVDRPIEGVIKADDARHLRTELEEYIVTGEVNKGLSEFCERYLNETNANGVWISGFFGSGKSHLLKILSLILDREPLAGAAVRPISSCRASTTKFSGVNSPALSRFRRAASSSISIKSPMLSAATRGRLCLRSS